MRKRSFQTELHGAIVRRRELFGCGHQRRGKADTRGKTADASDDIARQNRVLVVKAEPVAQCQGPDQPVLVDPMPLAHLWLSRPIRVEAVKSIEDEIGVIASWSITAEDG